MTSREERLEREMESMVLIFKTDEDDARVRAEGFAGALVSAGIYFTLNFNEAGFEFEVDRDDFLRAVEEDMLKVFVVDPTA